MIREGHRRNCKRTQGLNTQAGLLVENYATMGDENTEKD